MTCYIVAFESIPNSDREKIRECIQTFGAYCPINATCWAIVTDSLPRAVVDKIIAVSPTSRVFVVRSGTAAAWRNAFSDAHTNWLKKNL